MALALGITLLVIAKVNNNKNLIIPVCIVYNFVRTLNDIFNAGYPIELANAFGISYQFNDLIILIFIGVLLLDLRYTPIISKNILNCFIFLITLLTGFSLVSGASQFGFSSEWMGDLRSVGSFVSAILFFVRFYSYLDFKKYFNFLDRMMAIILLLSIALWTLDLGMGIHVLPSQYNATLSDGGSTMRFVQPYQVLGIALYGLFLVNKDIDEKGIIRLKASIYVLTVILFQHRSIWLATGLGLVIIVIGQCSKRKLTYKLLLQYLAIVLIGGGIILFGSGDIVENIRNSTEVLQAFLSGGSLEGTTANTRVNVWNAVIEDLSGLSSIIGRPFGYGYGRSLGWTTSPHSGIIRFLARTGYLGLFLLIILILYVVIKFISKKQYTLGYLVCIVAFMYGYDFTWLCGAVIGCYIAASKNTFRHHLDNNNGHYCLSNQSDTTMD